IRVCAYAQITGSFLLNSSSFFNISWNIASAHKYLDPFLQYLSKYEGDYYLEWKIFTNGFPAVQQLFEEWLREMENKGKRPKGHVEGLKKAVELKNMEGEIKKRAVEWKNVKDDLMPLLDNNHFMVRAGAAKCTGLFYPHTIEN